MAWSIAGLAIPVDRMAKKRVNIGIEEDIHLKAKAIAVLNNITLNEFFEKAIEDAIEKNKDTLKRLTR